MDPTHQVKSQIVHCMTSRTRLTWAMAGTALVALAITAYRRSHRKFSIRPTEVPPERLDRILRLQHGSGKDNSDPPLLQKHSTFKSYTTPYATYSSVRTFYHPHPHAEKLPQESHPLPLLVLLHGLGGSLSQFAPLLGSLVNVAPCLGVDLPGSGLSKFEPKSWDAYSIEAMATLLTHVIDQHRTEHGHRDVVLIGHSMGCSIAALLASSTSPVPSRVDHVAAFIAICPKGTPPSKNEAWYFSKILSMPDFLLNAFRWYDKRGGIDSPSVIRFVGEAAGPDLRRLQLRFNSSFPTAVWRRVAWGCLPIYDKAGEPHGGMPGRSVWAGLKVPVLLIAGQADNITKPEEIQTIISFLNDVPPGDASHRESAAFHAEAGEIGSDQRQGGSPDVDDTEFGVQSPRTLSKSQHSALIKTAVLPAPATHALLYDPATHRTLAGLIEDFLSRHVSHRLNLGWQLQQLTTSGKWDVKNLGKWKGLTPVSEPIAGGIFRGIKTLREHDEEHTPAVFAMNWRDRICAIIDISHDRPVYDPVKLEENGIRYHKIPTVSKIPPTVQEVRDFIAVVDQLRAESDQHHTKDVEAKHDAPAIAVHCHYGYNRTGFFIVSYLVEREGYRVQDAIDEFGKQRPPGIRHEHFIDTLFVRYCVGLQRAPSILAED